MNKILTVIVTLVAASLLLVVFPLGALAQSVQLRDGDARTFADGPEVIAYANVNHVTPPGGVTITDSGGYIWRYYEWIALMSQGQWIEATFSDPDTTSVGVQFWGDTNDGWARVLVDGSPVWEGSIYGTDPNWPGGAFVKYLQVSGLTPGPHTIRVENMGINGPGGSDDVCIYFFGSSSNTTELTLTPEQLDFSVQPKYDGGLIYTSEPDRQPYPPKVSLRVEQGADVAWNAQRPNWINVTPSSGTTPNDNIKISLNLTPDDAKYAGSRQGQVTFTATNSAQAILQVNVTIDPPRYITPTALIDFLSVWGYTSASSMPSPLPAGAVIFWTRVFTSVSGLVMRSPYAHSTVVLSSSQQIEMARASHWFAGTPVPSSNVGGTYEFGEIWIPPAGSDVDLVTIAQLFPDGGIDREYGTAEAWNCHGFSANVVHRGVNTFMRVQPGTLFNKSDPNTLNVLLGSVWHDGLEGMTVTVPPGVFEVHSQFLVEVFADGLVTFYLFEGSATYMSNSGSDQSVLQPEEMVNVDAAGVPGDVTAFDPSDLDRWWEQISIEPASPPLILYLPIILQSSS